MGLDAALPRVAAFTRALRALRRRQQQERERERGAGADNCNCGNCDCPCHAPAPAVGEEEEGGLYVAAVDVEKCYDHIRPLGLLALLRGAFCFCSCC